MNDDELERIWKEAVLAYWKHCPGICLEGERRLTKNLTIVGILAEIRTEHVPNRSQRRCVYTSLYGNCVLLVE
jgi:hypothetical protein